MEIGLTLQEWNSRSRFNYPEPSLPIQNLTKFVGNVVIKGQTIFEGNVKYLSDITFQGRTIFNKDTEGFRILLEEPAIVDLKFSWIALAIKDASGTWRSVVYCISKKTILLDICRLPKYIVLRL